MIITKQWLNEWIDISDISTEKLCETFNSIGLEVDSVIRYKMPENVVIGLVEEKEPHPDAKKLSVCMVNTGKDTYKIVCGAKNVQKGQFIALALQGAVLPNGLKIKPTTLRGVESNGMICSSTELGLPKINDGIMVLDDSIGKLEIGKSLKDYPLLNDDVIDIELTANRGDCLSIHGIARDLSVALNKDLKDLPLMEEDENLLGIGRILSVHVEDKLNSSFIYKALEFKKAKDNLLMEIRLKTAELEYLNPLQRIINYVTYSTGVLMRAYNFECFSENEKATIHVKKDKNGFDCVFGNGKLISQVGFSQEKECALDEKSTKIIIEANYIDPKEISRLGMEHKNLKRDFHYYNSSRGSEPDLDFGIKYFDILLSNEEKIVPYGGVQSVICEKEPEVINLEVSEANAIIGQDIEKNKIVKILKGLGCEVMFKVEQDLMSVKVPLYRHDIGGKQDICEEIVRIVGIDNIASKPYMYAEKSRTNQAYLNFKKRYKYRYKSVSAGFFESVHYVFDDREKMDKYDIRGLYKNKELANPISNELNTLRATLALHLIEAVSFNIKNNKHKVSLFEIGKTFNPKREESEKIAWIFSGEMQEANVQNHGKPQMINFAEFTSKISQIIGKFELKRADTDNKLYNPYEYASLHVEKEKIGYIARIHAKVEQEYDIMPTYICELDFDKLPMDKKIAHDYSKFPTSHRDLSVLVPKEMTYDKIRDCIKSLKISKLIKFFPVDRFESKELKENVSLSIRFVFQDETKTLEDEDVNKMINEILKTLDKKLGIKLR